MNVTNLLCYYKIGYLIWFADGPFFLRNGNLLVRSECGEQETVARHSDAVYRSLQIILAMAFSFAKK